MRAATIIDAKGKPVTGAATVSNLRDYHADRVANGEAFPGETVVRLPRRMTRVGWYENNRTMWKRLDNWLRGSLAPIDSYPQSV